MATKLDPWLRDIIRDPIGKTPLRFGSGCLFSEYGRRYDVIDGIPDLRALNLHSGTTAESWKRGQIAYEKRSAGKAEISGEDYEGQRRGVGPVYRELPVVGRCLDVGGNDGRLRAFLNPAEEYVSIDPYLEIVREPRSEECRRVYPFLDEPLNFIAALAEHLPFSSESFAVVHMRSVIDHFASPELALREAFRVLRGDGQLIVGLTVRGGKAGRDTASVRFKETARSMLVGAGFSSFEDHHIWHPTYDELRRLIDHCGFHVDKTHWQASEHDRVCYIRAVKNGNTG